MKDKTNYIIAGVTTIVFFTYLYYYHNKRNTRPTRTGSGGTGGANTGTGTGTTMTGLEDIYTVNPTPQSNPPSETKLIKQCLQRGGTWQPTSGGGRCISIKFVPPAMSTGPVQIFTPVISNTQASSDQFGGGSNTLNTYNSSTGLYVADLPSSSNYETYS